MHTPPFDDADALTAARALLEWYAEAGVHESAGDAPINRCERPLAPPSPPPAAATAATADHGERSHRATTVTADEAKPTPSRAKPAQAQATPEAPPPAFTLARKLADEADSVEALRAMVCGFDALSICKTANQTVFADGVATSKVMIIGEAPGAEEDVQGVPFCGASGKLLEQALNAVGLKRTENYYISNTIFWRPPANRKPSDEELAACRPFVEKHIALIRPKVLLLSGGTAAQSLLNDKSPVTKLRGRFIPYTNRYLNDAEIPALVVFHPSYLLRSPGQKRFMWRDLLALEAKLAEG